MRNFRAARRDKIFVTFAPITWSSLTAGLYRLAVRLVERIEVFGDELLPPAPVSLTSPLHLEARRRLPCTGSAPRRWR